MKFTRRMKLFLISMALLLVLMPAGAVLGQKISPPSPATPIFESEYTPSASNSVESPALPFAKAEALDLLPALQAGGDRLVALQNDDGGWDWPLDDGNPANVSPKNTVGPIAMGLAQAYLQTGDAAHLATLTDAGGLLLTKTNNFSPSDGYLAAQLDAIFGGTTYVDHVVANFYAPLAAGTYDRNGAGTLYTTASYVAAIRDYRSGDYANLAAWDIGMGLVGASMCGASTAEWLDGLKAEIDELDGDGVDEYFDVIGLAGAVYGLAFVGEDYDPTAGEHAAASSLADLAAILAGYQLSSGGFTWTATAATVSSDEANQETAYALLALNEFNRTMYISNIKDAAVYLRSVQLGTGGWDNYPGDPDGENNEITGEALWAISYEPETVAMEMFYSQATYDGWILESGENTNTGGLLNTTNLTCLVGDSALNEQYRTFLHFNTSRIPDDAVVTKVTVQYKVHSTIGDDPYATHGKVWADIKEGFFSNNAGLLTSDFAAAPSQNLAGFFEFTPSILAYPIYRADIKGDYLQYLNMTGITQFRLHFGLDDDNDNTADYLKIFCGDMPEPFNRPVLRVWYYVD